MLVAVAVACFCFCWWLLLVVGRLCVGLGGGGAWEEVESKGGLTDEFVSVFNEASVRHIS